MTRERTKTMPMPAAPPRPAPAASRPVTKVPETGPLPNTLPSAPALQTATPARQPSAPEISVAPSPAPGPASDAAVTMARPVPPPGARSPYDGPATGPVISSAWSAPASSQTTLVSPAFVPGAPPPTAPNASSAPVPGVARPTYNAAPSVLTVQFPQAGSVLQSRKGSYQVLSVLGAGEFGAVYECIGPFDQIYALKMFRPANRPYADVYAEWAKETQRLLSLRHPNVVYIHDAFEQDYLFYLALERCDHPLKAMLGTPMTEGLVLELARQTCAAIQFLHDNDVVHDDLHPGNVLITHTDRPVVKISDFGISHELKGAPAIRPDVVHHAIMAPEILATGYTSRQSDLYQVGLLLYWMLTGEPAIPPGLPYNEILSFVAAGEPRKRAEAIGTPCGQLVAKMLRRRDTYRYTSAREIWAELRELPSWRERQLFPVK